MARLVQNKRRREPLRALLRGGFGALYAINIQRHTTRAAVCSRCGAHLGGGRDPAAPLSGGYCAFPAHMPSG
ncbi:MAG: hypothetical protein DBX45_07115 [Oscillospiraceae bacterium]|nr:MAG: hypothetical protein DBX45_07115 [Oscillospiraceae bacterium]